MYSMTNDYITRKEANLSHKNIYICFTGKRDRKE